MTITGDTLLTASVRHPGTGGEPENAAGDSAPGSSAVTMPAWASVRLERHEFSTDTTMWPRPDYSVNEQYSQVREAWRFQENADIGAGALVTGRLAIITFHSVEDKAVTNRMREWATRGQFPASWRGPRDERPPLGKLVSKKPILPSENEVKENPASRSARLRIFEFS